MNVTVASGLRELLRHSVPPIRDDSKGFLAVSMSSKSSFTLFTKTLRRPGKYIKLLIPDNIAYSSPSFSASSTGEKSVVSRLCSSLPDPSPFNIHNSDLINVCEVYSSAL